MHEESVCQMYLIDNLDSNPRPKDIHFIWTAAGPNALYAPERNHPEWKIAQEPTVVELPNGRLFTVMRTHSGSPYYAVSTPGGRTWEPARKLLFGDGRPPVLHSQAPCPIYQISHNKQEFRNSALPFVDIYKSTSSTDIN